MKTFTKLVLAGALLLGSRAASAQVLYDDFETTRRVTYAYVDGNLDQAANNPGTNAVNGSSKCGKYDRSAAQFAVIVINPTAAPGKLADVTAYKNGTKRITVKFRGAAVGTAVQLVLQDKTKSATGYPNGNYAGTFNATTTVANAWETLSFTFTAGAAGGFDPSVGPTDVDQLVLLVAPNTTATGTYYLDDFTGPELVPPTTAPTAQLLDNFENVRFLSYPTALGTLNQAAPNPGTNAVNGSATCASYVRDGSQQFAVIAAVPRTTIPKFSDVSAYAAGTQRITVKFRGPAVGTAIQLVLQNKTKAATGYPNGNYGGTFNTVTTVANAWETLTFTYAAGGGGSFDPSVGPTDVDQFVLLIAPNSNNASTYYLDDLNGPAPLGVLAARTAQTSTAALATPYPNPSAGRAYLPYTLTQAATVSLAVYDQLGRRVVAVLDNERRAAGSYVAEVPTARLAPGLYTCRLVVDGTPLTHSLSVE